MIGSALKKLAKENNMLVSNGVAYGSLRGYAATLCEGGGWKRIDFSTRFPDPVQKTAFMDAVSSIGDKELLKRYRVIGLAMSDKVISVKFNDNPGTMKKLMAFLDWFIPLLGQYQAAPATHCAECGLEIQDHGSWFMIDGTCHHVHSACSEKVERSVNEQNEQEKQERTGSYLSGTVGAFLGAALGAVVWAIVLYIGYVASIVGLLIGWLAEKGYTLLKGKQGKGKIAILILAIIFGVLLGTLVSDVITVVSMINAGELGQLTYGDIPWLLAAMAVESPEYLRATLSNAGMGLLFAALGVFALLKKTGREVSDTKFIRLN